jgi:hypothetical protein
VTRELTPTLTTVLNAIIDKHLADVHTSLPAEIISYDYAKNLAVVRPLLKRKYKTEEAAIIMPTISSVPVAFQRMGPAHLRLPINPGDTGQLVFVERSIDGWLISGGAVDPLDPRKHSLSDAVFYPGLNPNNNPIVSASDQKSVELKLKNSRVEILDNGKFKITNSTEELFDLLVQMLGKMIDEMFEQGEVDTTHTIWGPLQPNNFANYIQLKLDYQALKTKMESLKG